jgi:hypothetical protein
MQKSLDVSSSPPVPAIEETIGNKKAGETSQGDRILSAPKECSANTM